MLCIYVMGELNLECGFFYNYKLARYLNIPHKILDHPTKFIQFKKRTQNMSIMMMQKEEQKELT